MLTTSFAIKTTKKKQQHKKEIDMLDGYLWLKISLDFTTNVTDQINCYMTSWQNGSKAYYISPFHLIWMLPLSNYHHRCRHLRLSFDFLEMFDHKQTASVRLRSDEKAKWIGWHRWSFQWCLCRNCIILCVTTTKSASGSTDEKSCSASSDSFN